MKKLCSLLFFVISITACSSVSVGNSDRSLFLDDTSVPKIDRSPTFTPADTQTELTELIGTHWILKYLEGHPPIAETLISLQIGPNYFSGSAGCNRYSAEYTAKLQNGFSIDELAKNTADCLEPEGVLEQENHYTELLLSSVTYQLVEQELFLIDAQGAIVLRYQIRQIFDVTPDALIDKTWRLISATDLETDRFSEFMLSFDESTFSGTTVAERMKENITQQMIIYKSRS